MRLLPLRHQIIRKVALAKLRLELFTEVFVDYATVLLNIKLFETMSYYQYN